MDLAWRQGCEALKLSENEACILRACLHSQDQHVINSAINQALSQDSLAEVDTVELNVAYYDIVLRAALLCVWPL